MVEVTVCVPCPYTDADLRRAVLETFPMPEEDLLSLEVRKEILLTENKPHLTYRLHVGIHAVKEREAGLLRMRKKVRPVTQVSLCFPKKTPMARPVVIGAGPAGLFCALALAKAGARPILLERGQRVEERQQSVRTFFSGGALDSESNVAFGEGGAGTFSDGKLKFGTRDAYVDTVLSVFIQNGAPENISYCSLPHVGTDRLVTIVRGIRQQIEALGGEVRFDTRVTDIMKANGNVQGVFTICRGTVGQIETNAIFLATGHSARDVYRMLSAHGVPMCAKGFGIGVRIEHPAEYIDRLIYGAPRPDLGHASYHLVEHLPTGRSVYSFCMCPGGDVICASSEPCGIVTNGMSTYSRGSGVSNAALLVSVTPADFPQGGVLGGIELQASIERAAYAAAGGYCAPSVRLDDFLHNRETVAFGEVKPRYLPGVSLVPFTEFLPEYVHSSLQKGILSFDAWLPGYKFGDAVLTGPETRTTSAVRILRDALSMDVPGFSGLYPCGEGAGYGGGIVSSAVDGLRAAQAYLEKL